MAIDSHDGGISVDVGAGADSFYLPDEQWGTTQPVAGLTFAPEISRWHWRLDAGAVENVYVVGDVHGCVAELQRLWRRIDPSEREMVLFVGDLVRKGPASVDVVEFVRERENAMSVRGNNEAKIARRTVDTKPFESIVDTVRSLPLVLSWDDSMIVHGGVDPTRPLATHGPDDVLEMRSVPPENGYDGPFWFERHDGPQRIFFGHTVLAAPFVSEHAVGLDTGCVYGGSLTAYDCGNDELISVPAERPYRDRPAEKIIEM